MSAAPADHLDFATLKGHSIRRLCVLALDENSALESRRGDVELLLDDGSERVVSFDHDRGLVLSSGKASLPPCETLSDWFDTRENYGVIVRAELPESDLRNALYDSPIEDVLMETDAQSPRTPICVNVVTSRVMIQIGVAHTICVIDFELKA
jgi:hypothetical protein